MPKKKPSNAASPRPAQSAAPREPQQARSKRTVETILDAGEALLREPGPEGGLQMRALARKADVGQGTLYEYFPTLEAVREAREIRAWGRLTERMRDVVLEQQGTGLENVVRHLVMTAMREMVVPAKIHGLRTDATLWEGRRHEMLKQFVAFAQTVLEARGLRVAREDAEMALSVATYSVVNAIMIGVRFFEADYASERFSREVAEMVIRYVVPRVEPEGGPALPKAT